MIGVDGAATVRAIRTAKWAASRLGGWLRRLLPGGAPDHRPEFGPEAVLAVAADARDRPASFDDAVAALARGAREEARALLCRHFRTRQAPRFFLSPQEAARKAGELARRRPAWRGRTLEVAAQWCERGLPVYEAGGPPLDAAYPWAEPVPEGRRDRLYWLRPHRFAFAPQLALAGLYDPALRPRLTAILRSWREAAAGPAAALAYSATLPVAQRLLALDWARTFVAAGGDAELEADLLEVLAADVAYLQPRIGTAVANNHLLAERFIDWYLRLLYPELTGGDAEHAEDRWLEELERQTYADGGGFEHALHYHEFGCEMLLAYTVLSHRNGRSVPARARERLARMLDFQIAASVDAEPLPFGNGTEDPMFPLDPRGSHACAGWRALRRAMDGGGWPADADDPGVERVFWLSGGFEDLEWLCPPAADGAPGRTERVPPSPLRIFPSGGLARFDDPALAMCVVLRTGPADGVPVFGGHMHADLLSLYLIAGQRPLVTDAGTYSYRRRAGSPNAVGGPGAAWFAGPAAHNGYYLPGHDPLGTVRGDFRPSAPAARVRITCHEAGRRLAAVAARIEGGGVYDGCLRGVVHVAGRYWIVWHVPGPQAPAAGMELRLQAAAETAATLEPDGVRLTSGAGGAAMVLLGPGLTVEDIAAGAVQPPAGWISPAYGVAVPAPQIRVGGPAPGRACAFAVAPPGAIRAVAHAETLYNGGLWVSVTGGGYTDALLLGGEETDVEGGGVRFRGRLLWLRSAGGRLAELRAIGLRSLAAPSIGLALEGAGCVQAAGVVELGDDEIAIGNGTGTT